MTGQTDAERGKSPLTARTDVVGSLLRPPQLLVARQAVEDGSLSWRQFKAIEDVAIDEAVRLQEDAGLEVITDGEFRRLSFQSQMTEAVDGFGDWDIDAFLWGIGMAMTRSATGTPGVRTIWGSSANWCGGGR